MQHEVIENVQAPWLSGSLGLAIIVLAFLISIVNASLETPIMFISMTLQPFIFVGISLLLFHIGTHVHAVHQNVILMAHKANQGEHDRQRPE